MVKKPLKPIIFALISTLLLGGIFHPSPAFAEEQEIKRDWTVYELFEHSDEWIAKIKEDCEAEFVGICGDGHVWEFYWGDDPMLAAYSWMRLHRGPLLVSIDPSSSTFRLLYYGKTIEDVANDDPGDDLDRLLIFGLNDGVSPEDHSIDEFMSWTVPEFHPVFYNSLVTPNSGAWLPNGAVTEFGYDVEVPSPSNGTLYRLFYKYSTRNNPIDDNTMSGDFSYSVPSYCPNHVSESIGKECQLTIVSRGRGNFDIEYRMVDKMEEIPMPIWEDLTIYQPEIPDEPVSPEEPEEPEIPDNPNDPDNPEDPNNPDISNDPENPDNSDDPGDQNNPEAPGDLDDTDGNNDHDSLNDNNDPDDPSTPETPNGPEAPEAPSDPEEPEESETPETPENAKDKPITPVTESIVTINVSKTSELSEPAASNAVAEPKATARTTYEKEPDSTSSISVAQSEKSAIQKNEPKKSAESEAEGKSLIIDEKSDEIFPWWLVALPVSIGGASAFWFVPKRKKR